MAKITIEFGDGSSVVYSTEAHLSPDGIGHKVSQMVNAPVAVVEAEPAMAVNAVEPAPQVEQVVAEPVVPAEVPVAPAV